MIFYSQGEIELTIDNLFATAHSVEDAGYITAARHMRNAADILQAVLDARGYAYNPCTKENTRAQDTNRASNGKPVEIRCAESVSKR